MLVRRGSAFRCLTPFNLLIVNTLGEDGRDAQTDKRSKSKAAAAKYTTQNVTLIGRQCALDRFPR